MEIRRRRRARTSGALGGKGVLPFSDDYSGSLSAAWNGTTLAIVDGKLQITPTLGASMVRVGTVDDFEGGGTR
jgi:hypothetical protein